MRVRAKRLRVGTMRWEPKKHSHACDYDVRSSLKTLNSWHRPLSYDRGRRLCPSTSMAQVDPARSPAFGTVAVAATQGQVFKHLQNARRAPSNLRPSQQASLPVPGFAGPPTSLPWRSTFKRFSNAPQLPQGRCCVGLSGASHS